MMLFPVAMLSLSTVLALPAPARSVAVFQLTPRTGIPASTAATVTDIVASEVRHSGVFARTISPADLAVMIPKAQQQEVVQCMMDPCAVVDNEITGGLGVDYVLYGSLAHLGQTFVINLQLYDLHTSLVAAQATEQIPGTTDEAFLREVKPSVRKLLAGLAQPNAAPPTTKPAQPGSRLPLIAGLVAAGVGGVAVILGALLGGVATVATVAWPRDPTTHNVLVLGPEGRQLAQMRVIGVLALVPVGAAVSVLGAAAIAGATAVLIARLRGASQ